MRQPFDDRAVVETDSAFQRQADVRLDLAALDLDAVGLERALDVVERARRAGAAGLALPGGDCTDVIHEGVRRDLGGELAFERVAVLPGRRHAVTSRMGCRA